MFNFDDASKQSKDAMDGMLKSYSEVAKGFQAIATETTDYSKKSFQDLTSYVEALTATRTVEAAYDLQTRYIRSSYEGFMAQSSKIGEMYVELAKTAYKTYEPPVAQTTAVVVPNAA
ncbi:phasin family protein [Rhizobium sp. XQZ8]|uniref:phasin family protein n=1 Tax=Rhizobium populisoli TaxID=2859785 RepID=UPI001C668FD6|nr:phasin family protein [Rhizobium populisoli]MBW6420087.1 phasin family protein [Rhizobium populisoli]